MCSVQCVSSTFTHSSGKVDRHHGVGGEEEVSESCSMFLVIHNMAVPRDEPAQTEIICTVRPEQEKMTWQKITIIEVVVVMVTSEKAEEEK